MLIAGLASEFPVKQLCAVLGVTRSSYYAWKTCKTYLLSQHKEAIAKRVKKVSEAQKGVAGHVAYMPVGRYQIRQRMQEMGLKAIQPKSYVPRTTQTNPHLKRSANLLLEMDMVNSINQVWIGDITYLPLPNRVWAYLATWMDLNSRRIVRWKVSASMGADIIFDSFKKAVEWRRPKVGLIVHSDGGG